MEIGNRNRSVEWKSDSGQHLELAANILLLQDIHDNSSQ